MTLPLTITDNYILITSDEGIKEGEWCYIPFEHSIKKFGKYFADDWKKVIAHLPITDSADLRGVPLLPPLPSGEDVEKMAEEYSEIQLKGMVDKSSKFECINDFITGYQTCKEKYRFSEEDMRIAIRLATTSKHDATLIFFSEKEILQSLSQPKMPIGFKCEMSLTPSPIFYSNDVPYHTPKIINGVMQGEWIY